MIIQQENQQYSQKPSRCLKNMMTFQFQEDLESNIIPTDT